MTSRISKLALLLTFSVATACSSSTQQVRAETPVDEPGPTASDDDSADMASASLENFREPLAPYGQWIEDPTYGTVWVPSAQAVGPDFTPYMTGGHWGMTADDQWIWVSDYDWGWAPFHYGRWVQIDGPGWAWIAGGVYAPAWVVWQTGYYDEAYVGWAPMPPAWYWRGGVAVSVAVMPTARFVYVPSRHVFQAGLRGYVVVGDRARIVAGHSQPYSAARVGVQYHALAMAHGPRPSEARIPADAMPAQRVAHDPRALQAQHAAPAKHAAPARREPNTQSAAPPARTARKRR
jgi:hypothetical protein